jgi:hypothetical protein
MVASGVSEPSLQEILDESSFELETRGEVVPPPPPPPTTRQMELAHWKVLPSKIQ